MRDHGPGQRFSHLDKKSRRTHRTGDISYSLYAILTAVFFASFLAIGDSHFEVIESASAQEQTPEPGQVTNPEQQSENAGAVGQIYVNADAPVENYFRFLTIGQVPESKMAELSSTLSEYRLSVMEHLGVTEMPKVTVNVWNDRDAFEEAYGENAQFVRGYIDPETWSIHIYNTGRLGLGTVHEFTHLVSLARNPNIVQNPKWLWEAVAIYESNRPPPPNPSTLACITTTTIPTLNDLNEHPMNIYRVGYLLAEFIATTWSQQALGELIATNGDISISLNLPSDEFEKMWLEYVISRYNIQTPSDEYTTDC